MTSPLSRLAGLCRPLCWLALPLLLTACATAPRGPSVMVLPGTGRSFDQFQFDAGSCRQYAWQQSGGSTAQSAANEAALRNAAVGTVVGAVAGAAIGGRDAAGVGAGTGLLVGSMSGDAVARGGSYGSQRSYDQAYIQCMYAKGHRVPVTGNLQQVPVPAVTTPATPAGGISIPPPPPGLPPAPPPGVR